MLSFLNVCTIFPDTSLLFIGVILFYSCFCKLYLRPLDIIKSGNQHIGISYHLFHSIILALWSWCLLDLLRRRNFQSADEISATTSWGIWLATDFICSNSDHENCQQLYWIEIIPCPDIWIWGYKSSSKSLTYCGII